MAAEGVLTLNLAAFVPVSFSNGPGRRAVVWVQGCPFRCPGCWNPHTHEFLERMLVDVRELAGSILATPGLDGVTFSGGEPFAQAWALGALGEAVREAGLSVITFTGYLYERLRDAHRPDWDRLLSVTDLLVDGPYIQSLRTKSSLRGSANQRLIFLTERLRGHPALAEEARQKFEVHVGADGSIVTTGFPPVNPKDLSDAVSHYGLVIANESVPADRQPASCSDR